MKKILVFYAMYGGGHLSAAKAIKEYIEKNYDDVEIQMVDCIKYVNKTIDKLTTGAYKQFTKRAPWLWKKIYYNSQKGALSKISNGINKMMTKKLSKLFNEFKPDIVISAHPFSSQMTTILKKNGITNCTLATVMTDFVPHEQWLINEEYADYIFVSNEKMKNKIVNEMNIDKDKIYVTGIPVSERFSETFNKEKIYNELNLYKNMQTVLFFGGGQYGLGKEKTVAILKILAQKENLQIIAIAGKNPKMQKAFKEIVKEYNKQNFIKVLSFTDKIPELMHISDLVITKPGGLTVSESLVSSLPILLINPIPGQEEENAEFLENSGCAKWIKKDSNAEDIINSVLDSGSKLNKMKENSIKLAKKDSTSEICRICLGGKENNND